MAMCKQNKGSHDRGPCLALLVQRRWPPDGMGGRGAAAVARWKCEGGRTRGGAFGRWWGGAKAHLQQGIHMRAQCRPVDLHIGAHCASIEESLRPTVARGRRSDTSRALPAANNGIAGPKMVEEHLLANVLRLLRLDGRVDHRMERLKLELVVVDPTVQVFQDSRRLRGT
eukprot:scaffold15163_cov125-Isochrysis_galbana.AAC.3